jgi:hypothetical protein
MKAGLTAGALCLVLMALPGTAEDSPDCGKTAAALATIEGYEVSVPPAGPDNGWCVLDGARFRSARPGWPDLDVDRLRLRQTATEVELDLRGLRATPRASDREVDDRIRSLIRLQSADLRLLAVHDPEAGVLSVAGLRLDLSGGTTLELDADIREADLTVASLAGGAVTRARLIWRNDGRLLRPVMEIAGGELSGATGSAAVEALRAALGDFVAALPETAIDTASRKEFATLVRSLPQARGKLTLEVVSGDGISGVRIGFAALSGDKALPEVLAAVLQGATITADWQPGLAP